MRAYPKDFLTRMDTDGGAKRGGCREMGKFNDSTPLIDPACSVVFHICVYLCPSVSEVFL